MTTQLSQTFRSLLLIGMITSACVAQTQIIEVDYTVPTLDRWNYPFNGSPGTRLSGSTFGAVELEGFDDHDAQLVLGFSTIEDILDGLDPSEYRILSATVTITNTNADEFRYDPTYDTHDTYMFFDESLDTDLGRPINLWAAGYRNGFDQSTWNEFTTFGGIPDVDPAQGARNLFAAYFPDGATATDVSNNLKEEFDATPMAIGQADTVTPGDTVPADTTFSFDIDLCDPATQTYIANGLSMGEVRFVATSLSTASGGDGGGTGDVLYPIWYTRENPIAQIFGFTPTLHLRVRIGNPGDYNADGSFNFFDVSAFLSDFNAGSLDADLTGDCTLNFFDVSAFLSAFLAG